MKKYNLWAIPCALLFSLLFTNCDKKNLTETDTRYADGHYSHKSGSSSLPPDSFGVALTYSDLATDTVADIVNLATTYTPNITNILVEFDDGSDTTISLTSVMLAFDDTTDYFQALEISAYFPYDTIDYIVSSFSSYSNPYFDFMSNAISNGVVDVEGYIEDLVELKFARLYNTDNAVRIGDSVFVEFFNKDAVLVYDLATGNHTVLNYAASSSNCPNQQRGPIFVSSWYDSSGKPSGEFSYYILSSYKFNRANFFEARVEFGFMLHKYTPGTVPYNPVALNNFGIWLDVWNQCCYKKPSQSTYTCVSNKRVGPEKPPYYNPFYKVASRYGFGVKSYCVNEFGRTHNWVWNYNEDVHHDIW